MKKPRFYERHRNYTFALRSKLNANGAAIEGKIPIIEIPLSRSSFFPEFHNNYIVDSTILNINIINFKQYIDNFYLINCDFKFPSRKVFFSETLQFNYV